MGELDAVGDAATGGILAHTVEPAAGEGKGPTRERNCLNCGCGLVGDFCHCCGQKAHVHRTLGAFGHDLLHGVLHFEGKIWRTLPMLAWRPGELTRRYVDGERARFVSPLALFLFTVFLMFALFSALGMGVDGSEFNNSKAAVQAALDAERKELAGLEAGRRTLLRNKAANAVSKMDRQIAQSRNEIAELEQFLAATKGQSSEIVGGKTGWKSFDEGLKKLNANPTLMLYKVKTNAYKFSWALIPISLPFLWLLFLHRKRYRQYGAYDHVVFITYSISFMSIALIVLALIKQVPHTGWLGIAMLAVPPLHMYRQLRGAYRLSRWSAVWRTGALSIFAMTALAIFIGLLFALGALG
jgi:hypothetical protein